MPVYPPLYWVNGRQDICLFRMYCRLSCFKFTVCRVGSIDSSYHPFYDDGFDKNWLGRYIPQTMDTIGEYEKLIWEAQEFERRLQSMQWTQENVLHEWCSRAGEWWGKQHKMDVLDRVREIVRTGVYPYTKVTASMGALEYENVGSSELEVHQIGHGTKIGNLLQCHEQQDENNDIQPQVESLELYECTAISAPLLSLLGSLIHEYTHLPGMHIIQSAQQIYPTILRVIIHSISSWRILILYNRYGNTYSIN